MICLALLVILLLVGNTRESRAHRVLYFDLILFIHQFSYCVAVANDRVPFVNIDERARSERRPGDHTVPVRIVQRCRQYLL